MVDWSSYTVFVTEVTSKNMKNMYIFSKNMKVILVAGKIWTHHLIFHMNIYGNRIIFNIIDPEDIKLSVIAYSLDEEPDWIIKVINQILRFF